MGDAQVLYVGGLLGWTEEWVTPELPVIMSEVTVTTQKVMGAS